MATGIYEVDDNVVSHFALRELTKNEVEARDKEKKENKVIAKTICAVNSHYNLNDAFDNNVVVDDFFNCDFCGKTNTKTIEMIEGLQFLVKDGLHAVIDVNCANCKTELTIST